MKAKELLELLEGIDPEADIIIEIKKMKKLEIAYEKIRTAVCAVCAVVWLAFAITVVLPIFLAVYALAFILLPVFIMMFFLSDRNLDEFKADMHNTYVEFPLEFMKNVFSIRF